MMMIRPNRVRRMLTVALAVMIFLLPPAASFAQEAAAGGDTILAILQPEDAVPRDAMKLKQVLLSGNDYGQDCAYYELLLKSKGMAVALGANVLRINARTQHARNRRCDELEVIFYKSADPRKAEQSFQWNAARPLTWEDFKGPVRTGAGGRIAAETSCGIAIETNLVLPGGKARIYVFNTFEKRTSWVRQGQALADVLEHEQGHWNICELYTRRMQARFDSTEIAGAMLNGKVNEIYNDISREYIQRQELYEQETQHGTIGDAQQRWTKAITQELGLNVTGRL